MVGTVPRSLADWMWPFVRCFTGATWDHVLVLVAGALLSPGRRTVSAALRVMDLDQSASFAVYHRVLSTASWSARRVAQRLLHLLVAAFVREGPVVIGLDEGREPCADALRPAGRFRAGQIERILELFEKFVPTVSHCHVNVQKRLIRIAGQKRAPFILEQAPQMPPAAAEQQHKPG